MYCNSLAYSDALDRYNIIYMLTTVMDKLAVSVNLTGVQPPIPPSKKFTSMGTKSDKGGLTGHNICLSNRSSPKFQ
ncbi:hypothetical protein PHET_01772 [Paragonimus heterotremus]|uniref:Uncharacterized protein n=1 Tax=Paragonimus heterotremus TaxID=100268 RepID=A0A8J4WKY8_9TREM|nr:hypothetical protein PHET_01772 [Paragonimus heterotremus]